MLTIFYRWLGVFLLCLIAPLGFASNNLVKAHAYYEDATNQLTIDQVKHQVFTPYEGILAKGFKASTFWLKLTIDTTNIPHNS